MRRDEAVLHVGLVGTFVMVLGAVFFVLSRVWSVSFTQTLEVAVASPFLAAWVLAPLFWAARPRGERPLESDAASADEAVVPLVTAVSLVAVGWGAYLFELVVRPRLFDIRPGFSSLLVVLVVPCVQWAIIASAGLVQHRLRGLRRQDPH